MSYVHVVIVLKVLALVGVANGAPVIAKRLLGTRAGQSLDGGRKLADRRFLFGPSKTFRGIVASTLATSAAAPVLGLPLFVGTVAALSAMAGDLLSSFVKRRLGIPPSRMCLGLDQIPEVLLPCLVLAALLPLSAIDIGIVVAGFCVGDLVVSRLMFDLGVRDTPI